MILQGLNIEKFVLRDPVILPWSGLPVKEFDIASPCEELRGCRIQLLPVGLILISHGDDFISIPISMMIGIGKKSRIVSR